MLSESDTKKNIYNQVEHCPASGNTASRCKHSWCDIAHFLLTLSLSPSQPFCANRSTMERKREKEREGEREIYIRIIVIHIMYRNTCSLFYSSICMYVCIVIHIIKYMCTVCTPLYTCLCACKTCKGVLCKLHGPHGNTEFKVCKNPELTSCGRQDSIIVKSLLYFIHYHDAPCVPHAFSSPPFLRQVMANYPKCDRDSNINIHIKRKKPAWQMQPTSRAAYVHYSLLE